MEPPRLLTIMTLAALIIIVWGVVTFYQPSLSKGIALNTDGQPTIGYPKAQVHVVVFEEPKCPDCRKYNKSVYPNIHKDFIETNKIRYTVFPVSFIPDSMPAATALLCTYNQDGKYPNPDLFFTYLNYIFEHQPPENLNWATTENLLDMAKQASPAINLEKLKGCIDTQEYRVQIVKNTQYGAEINDGRLSTPGVYIDGRKLDRITTESMNEAIEAALKQKGIR